jgi:signal transduction histidine kinase
MSKSKFESSDLGMLLKELQSKLEEIPSQQSIPAKQKREIQNLIERAIDSSQSLDAGQSVNKPDSSTGFDPSSPIYSKIDLERSQLKTIFDNAPEAIVVADRHGRVILANHLAAHLYGRPIPFGEDFPSHIQMQISYPDGTPYDPRDLPLTKSALDGDTYSNLELNIRRPDGKSIPVLVNTAPILDHNQRIIGAVGIFQDISERKKMEQDLKKQINWIKTQHHLMDKWEMERLEIARWLHEGPVQDLLGTLYVLQTAMHLAEETEMQNKLAAIRSSLEDTLDQLRNFSYEIRPPLLSHFDLVTNLKAYLQKFRTRYPDIQISYDFNLTDQDIPKNKQITLFRIVQEALTNIAHHAEANSIQVNLESIHSKLLLEIQDDGQGFNLPEDWLDLAQEGHLGLAEIRERTNAIGGELEIQSAPGDGSVIKVYVPTYATAN